MSTAFWFNRSRCSTHVQRDRCSGPCNGGLQSIVVQVRGRSCASTNNDTYNAMACRQRRAHDHQATDAAVVGVDRGALGLAAWIYIAPPGLMGKLDAIGYAVCHRLDSHSLHIGALQMPLCARCTGEFNAAAMALIFQGIVSPRRSQLPKRGIRPCWQSCSWPSPSTDRIPTWL